MFHTKLFYDQYKEFYCAFWGSHMTEKDALFARNYHLERSFYVYIILSFGGIRFSELSTSGIIKQKFLLLLFVVKQKQKTRYFSTKCCAFCSVYYRPKNGLAVDCSMFMYICNLYMYTYIYVSTYICILDCCFLSFRRCIPLYIDIPLHVCIHIYVYAYISVCIYVSFRVFYLKRHARVFQVFSSQKSNDEDDYKKHSLRRRRKHFGSYMLFCNIYTCIYIYLHIYCSRDFVLYILSCRKYIH